ncbi:MAG: exodeoxyribonuclease VII large subunit [candidate division Zixibacteria bacterium]|nr:exodeoxyribonuclease VII large subunit [candidate division Zixibacteria bacterium]
MPDEVYTVTAVNKMARYTIEESFPSLWVEGEVSNYHLHGSGHRYFSLKDDSSQIRCAMWRSYGQALKFEPKDGMKVIVAGGLTIYEKGGAYQLSVKKIIPSGVGELEMALRQLKEKLTEEGLFDPDHKKTLPAYPMKIGIVTSPTGAVIHDIIRVIKRRNPGLDIILWPTEVQGDIAAPQLAEGIQQINEYGEVDLIIIGRGGGSLEDLWAFNDERVVRAVYDSVIPVISAVGHEVDYTLTDMAADYSAATPSMAAEIAAWPLTEMKDGINAYLQVMKRSVFDHFRENKTRFREYIGYRVFRKPESIIEPRCQRLDGQIQLLRLLSENRFDTFRKTAAIHMSRLEALSPLGILARGYSVTRTGKNKKVVSSINDIEQGVILETIVPDGLVFSQVEKTEKKNEYKG